MTIFFRKGIKPDELLERANKLPDYEQKIYTLGIVLGECKGKYRQVGYKVIDEVLKISKDPIKDLKCLMNSLVDNEWGELIVDKIAGYGMEKNEVHQTLYKIGSHEHNKGARNKAREHYERYYDLVTGGNPLKKSDLLIPTW